MRRKIHLTIYILIVYAAISFPGIKFLIKNFKSEKTFVENIKVEVEAAAPSVTPTVTPLPTFTPTPTKKPTLTPSPHPTATPSPVPVMSATSEITPPAGIPINGIPVRLSIPKISLVAPIVESGKVEDGNMYVPPDAGTVGWWKYGAKPGELGSAVLAGHYKVDSGAPGVFFNLDKLTIGDEIVITLDNGNTLKFAINKKELFTIDQFPLDSFFTDAGAKGLNLITCAGSYVKSSKDYTHRLAIYSILKN